MDFYFEILAYIASVIVLISFIVKDINILRALNGFGCILFLAYALHYDRYPLVFLNGMIIIINLYYILKSKKIVLWKEPSKKK